MMPTDVYRPSSHAFLAYLRLVSPLQRQLVFSIDYTRFHTAERSVKALTERSVLNTPSSDGIYFFHIICYLFKCLC